MIFKRTASGLSSEHLFYRVDFVAYCEGRPPEGDDDSSLDALFWQRAFDAYSGKRVYCKTYGSKNDLLEIAEGVRQGNLRNIIVVMDRDYDSLFGRMLQHDRIIYTYGYSWESDAILAFDFDRVFTVFAAAPNLRTMKQEFDKFLQDIEPQLRRCLKIDVKYYLSEGALFNREKPQSIIVISRNAPPKIDCRTLLDNAKNCAPADLTSLDRGTLDRLSGLSHFHGKIVARIIYHWFVFRSSVYRTRQKVSMVIFMSTVINAIDWTLHATMRPLCHLRESILRAVV